MRCTHPLKLIKENGAQFQVPCGRCIACRLNHNNSWATRIVAESKSWKYSSFLTLTYDDEHLPKSPLTGVPTLRKRDAQLFFKRLRKEYQFRYFLGAEYGDIFHRPHFHACIFSNDIKNLDRSIIEKAWQNGFVRIGELNLASARYIAKYTVSKVGGELAVEKYIKQGIEPEFSLMSRRPGIGQFYIEKNKDMLRNHRYVVIGGKKQPLPRYFAVKIFDEEERNESYNERSLKNYDELCEIAKNNNVYLHDVSKIVKQKDSQRDRNIKARLALKKG